MPTAQFDNLWQVRHQGTLGTAEIFEHSWWITAVTTPLDFEHLLDVWAQAIPQFLAKVSGSGVANIAALFSSAAAWRSVSVRAYQTDPFLPFDEPHSRNISGSGTGTANTPYQLSPVVTVTNGRTTGRRRYNRWYPPPLGTNMLGAGGTFPTTIASDIAGWYNNFSLICEAPGPGQSAFAYFGQSVREVLPLTGLYMGNILDTQRRRRNALNEVRTSLSFT